MRTRLEALILLACAPAAFAGDGTTPITGPSWSFAPNQLRAQLTFVRAAGDVNGDGFGDVIASAPLFDTTNVDAGRAWLFLGSRNGLVPSPAWQSSGPDQAGAHFGSFVSAAGDVDGDGYDDVLVVADRYADPEIDEGVVYLYRGGPSGLVPTPAWSFEGNQPGRRITSAAYAGDINHDGYADVIVGAIDPTGAGVVFLFYGRAQGLSLVPNWTLTGAQLGLAVGSQLGSAVSTAGDVNSDGYDDFLIGAALAPDPAAAVGQVWLVLGGPTLPSTTPAWTASGVSVGDAFGANGNFGAAGDVNGDGYADVIVGAGGVGNDDHGVVYLFHGSASGLSTTPSTTIVGAQSFARFGDGASAAGDVNGDGFADIWIGSPLASNANGVIGRVELRLGGPNGVESTAVAMFDGSTFGSGAVASQFGSFVAPVGDVNGDGFADISVVAPLFDDPEIDEGKAWIFNGCARGIRTAYSWTASMNAGTRLGAAIDGGDFDGDGFSDLAVGAPHDFPGSIAAGTVEIFRGGPSGPSPTPSASLTHGQFLDRFGASIAATGDVNGDGFADLVVGAPNYTNGQTNEGALFLYLGGPAGLSTTPVWIFESDQANAHFGTSVAVAGDVNGDGFADIVVGAPGFQSTQANEGKVFLFLGSATNPLATLGWSQVGGLQDRHFGSTVSGAGDVNGDGFSDFLIASNGSTASVVLYLGSILGPSNAPASTLLDTNLCSAAGDVNGDGYADILVSYPTRLYFGSSQGLASTAAWTFNLSPDVLAPAGDLNGDGYADIALGDPYFDQQFYTCGEAWVFLGGPNGPGSTPHFYLSGCPQFAGEDWAFGAAIGAVGDVNGDGIGDLGIGAPGYATDAVPYSAAYVFQGNFGGGPAFVPEQRRSDDSAQIAPLGKSDITSSFRVRAEARGPSGLASTVGGRADVEFQWELKEQRVAFDGANLHATSALDTGTLGTPPVLDELVDGLVQGRTYHWRARFASRDPVFTHSRWLSAPVHCVTETMLRTFRDCNGNGIVDAEDIAQGTSPDTNSDGVPDECEGTLASFCFGDGSGVACPCANSGASGNGCANFANSTGANLDASGVPSRAHDTLVLHGSGMTPTSSVLYFQGTQTMGGGGGTQFGDGLRCAGGNVIRLGIEVNAGGASSYPGTAGDASIAVKGGIPAQGGVTRHYQAWYRDAALFCTSGAFNLTNGVSVSWSP